MLEISIATRIYYVGGFTDMRCGRYTLSNVVKNNLGLDPYDGSAYAFMSRDRTKCKILVFKDHMYRLYDLAYEKGYRFMELQDSEGVPVRTVERIAYNYLAALVGCPARTSIRL